MKNWTLELDNYIKNTEYDLLTPFHVAECFETSPKRLCQYVLYSYGQSFKERVMYLKDEEEKKDIPRFSLMESCYFGDWKPDFRNYIVRYFFRIKWEIKTLNEITLSGLVIPYRELKGVEETGKNVVWDKDTSLFNILYRKENMIGAWIESGDVNGEMDYFLGLVSEESEWLRMFPSSYHSKLSIPAGKYIVFPVEYWVEPYIGLPKLLGGMLLRRELYRHYDCIGRHFVSDESRFCFEGFNDKGEICFYFPIK